MKISLLHRLHRFAFFCALLHRASGHFLTLSVCHLQPHDLEDPNLLKLRSLDSSCPFFLSDSSFSVTMNSNAPNALTARLEQPSGPPNAVIARGRNIWMTPSAIIA